MNTFGDIFRVTTFGESHGVGLGCVVDGVPAGLKIDREALQLQMNRRRPGTSEFVSPRKEGDNLEIISGLDGEDVTLGTPIAMMVINRDARSGDYKKLRDSFRPGHADFTYYKKYGVAPQPGGGRSSGRETLARVAAGAVARVVLGEAVKIKSCCVAIGGVAADKTDFDFAENHPLRFCDPDKADRAELVTREAMTAGDSVGGVVLLQIDGAEAGLGSPVFGKLDAKLAAAMISIGAVKGIEFGAGFAATSMRGSECNDEITPDGFKTNNAGGILGGISTGESIVMRLAVKPTPSVSVELETIDLKGGATMIKTTGRHDPCVAGRISVVAEAMAAIVLADELLKQKTLG